MLNKRTMKKKLIISMSVVMLLAAMVAVTAFAADETGVELTGGSLSGGSIVFGNFGTIALTGAQQTIPDTWSINGITDARGSGLGWSYSLTLTQLDNGSGRTLPLNSITFDTAPTVTAADGTSSPAGDIAVNVLAGASIDTGLPISLLQADAGEGMGSYNVGWDAELTVPANAYAGTYTADATVSIDALP
jgi:hypothetical protein